MKNLTANELGWIDLQLKKYRKLFPEFHAEVYDHVVSAIELKKNEGDERDVKVIYHQVIDDDFNGYKGIKRSAVQYFMASRNVVWDVFVEVLKRNRAVNLPAGLAVIVIICFLPLPRILLNEIMAVICLILAAIPVSYTCYLVGFKNMFSNNEIKISITPTIAGYTIHMFNLSFAVVFGGIRLFIDKDFKPSTCHPAISALLMVCLLAYDISFVQFCNQEFKEDIAV